VPAHPAHGPGRIVGKRAHRESRRAARVRARRLSPSGPPAQPVAIGFKKANANHVPYTNPEITS